MLFFSPFKLESYVPALPRGHDVTGLANISEVEDLCGAIRYCSLTNCGSLGQGEGGGVGLARHATEVCTLSAGAPRAELHTRWLFSRRLAGKLYFLYI